MFLYLIPKILMIVILALAVISYFFKFKIRPRYLIIGALASLVVYSGILTLLQFEAWEHNELSKYLLPPYQSIRYFISYSWMHFWLSAAFSIASALIFLSILFLVKKARKNFFQDEDLEIGFLSVLAVGWPNFAIFLPLSFIIAIAMAICVKVFKKKDYSSFVLPFLIAALITILFGNLIMDHVGLDRLKI